MFPSDEDIKSDDLQILCKTFQGGRGTCLPILKCPSMQKERNLLILRNSICGFDGVVPKLCCPSSIPNGVDNGNGDPLEPQPSKPDKETSVNPDSSAELIGPNDKNGANIHENITPRPQPVKTTALPKPTGRPKQGNDRGLKELRVPPNLPSSKCEKRFGIQHVALFLNLIL